MRLSLVGLTVLTLLAGSGIFQASEAKVRIKATYKSPNDVRVRIGHTPTGRDIDINGHLKWRLDQQFRLGKQDRKIARRLSAYSGVPARRLLHLRADGYRWAEIGRFFNVPRPVIRAAKHDRSWNRFVRHGGLACGPDPHPQRRVALRW